MVRLNLSHEAEAWQGPRRLALEMLALPAHKADCFSTPQA